MSATQSRQAYLLVLDVGLQGVALAVLYGFVLRVLGAEYLGIWAIVMSIAVAGRVADLGLSRGLVRFVPLEEGTPHRVNALIDAAVVGTFIMAVPTVLLAGTALWFGLPMFLEGDFELAKDLVPWTLVFLVLSSFGQVYLNVLTAVYRSDLRAFSGIAGTASMIVACFALVEPLGLVGLLLAQCVQQLVTIAVAMGLYMRTVQGARVSPRFVSIQDLKTLLYYGWQLHLAGIAMLLFEPASRLIMGSVGSIEAVAYFDMASRLLQQVRNLLVTANQVMTPYFSKLSAFEGQDLLDLYVRASALTHLLALPLLGVIVGSADLLSVLWIGEHSPMFSLFLLILGVGWGMNAVSAPAYFLANGSGYLSIVVISHAIVAFGSSALALLLGWMFAEIGVVIGVAVGLSVGSLYCMQAIHRKIFNLDNFFVGLRPLYALICISFSVLGLVTWGILDENFSPLVAGVISAGSSFVPLVGIGMLEIRKWKLERTPFGRTS